MPFKQWHGQTSITTTYGEWEYAHPIGIAPAIAERIGGEYPAIFYRDVQHQQGGYYTVFGNPIRLNINRIWTETEAGHGRVRITKWAREMEITFNPNDISPGHYIFE